MFQPTKELSVTEYVSPWHELAEAARRGCEIYPNQAFGKWVDEWSRAACIVGAIRAGGGDVSRIVSPVACPLSCVWGSYNLQGVLQHLNDDHHMRREQIIDWMDGKILQR